ncbi:MAG: DUF1295 domain-containing protein [Nannocystaceae bacterium]|nr:DUF1295 domain-containing protein [Nannocystaceae bacterium]
MSGTDAEAKPKADQFGGPIGALTLTIVMPLAGFYLWAALEHHGGSMWLPRSASDLLSMFPAPTLQATLLFATFVAVHGVLYAFGPGEVVQGRPAPNGEQAEYRINGLFAFVVTTIGLVAALFFELLSAKTILEQWGPLLMVATLFSVIASVVCYSAGRRRGSRERSTGNAIYDFFMGTILNPRLGRHDLKFFFESRIGMGGWAAFAVLLPAAQIETQGSLSTAMLVVTLCQALYIVDFFVLEANLLSMIDIIEENLGFMLWLAFLVWMPFNFTIQQQYILAAEPSLSTVAAIGLLLLNAGGYYIFRSANLQKQQFRQDPSRPIWGTTPQSMQTKRGTKLLLSGWWGIARHANYFGDMLMALAWCLACGLGSIVPFFYVIYFVPLLLDRERRDNTICQRKYGADWDRYCAKVPRRIIPFVY